MIYLLNILPLHRCTDVPLCRRTGARARHGHAAPGLTDSFHLRHFSDVREKNAGELNSSVVEWLNKGLMAVSSPNRRCPRLAPGGDRGLPRQPRPD
eukprot:873353-Prorocentrum_minimum.AAC.1